jgi:REP element-mobilizing transposase RayT
VFFLHAHSVITTKFRHKVFEDRHLRRMEELLRQVCQDFECELVEFNGESEHVHLLVNFPPKVAVAKLVSPAVVERLLLRRLGRWSATRRSSPLHRESGEISVIMRRYGRQFSPALKDGARSPTKLVARDPTTSEVIVGIRGRAGTGAGSLHSQP